jgi:hypothetical protein
MAIESPTFIAFEKLGNTHPVAQPMQQNRLASYRRQPEVLR